MSPLNGKVALVTGASRGIGRAIAESLVRDGAMVIGTATTEKGAADIQHYLSAMSQHAVVKNTVVGRGMVFDVNDSATLESMLDLIEKDWGAVSILVNNAGITRDQLLMRMSEEDWDAVMTTNLRSVFRLSKAVLRGMMKARFGRIINIASVVGALGSAGQTNYAATKAGVMGFTRSLAREVGSRNITVNCVAPGFIDTDMTASLPEAYKATLLSNIPLARLGEPQEIAEAVVFLASNKAGYITGSTLHVNGGMYMG